jgi:hypothetical protein
MTAVTPPAQQVKGTVVQVLKLQIQIASQDSQVDVDNYYRVIDTRGLFAHCSC